MPDLLLKGESQNNTVLKEIMEDKDGGGTVHDLPERYISSDNSEVINSNKFPRFTVFEMENNCTSKPIEGLV